MLFSKEINGTYGSGKTPATIFVCNDGQLNWYAVEGSLNVNGTYEDIEEGVNVETLSDIDTMTAGKPIESAEDLERLVNDEKEEETAIYTQYDFENMDEFYNYIIESEVNGQRSQVKDLIRKLSKEQQAAFIKYCDAGTSLYPDVDKTVCMDLAIDILAE